MISVSDAVEHAAKSLKALMPTAENILLEEVEVSDDDQQWLITLSFSDPVREGLFPPGSILAHAGVRPQNRLYRVVRLNRETGEVRSVKIREPANV